MITHKPRVLALSFKGAGNFALSLKGVVESAFDFELSAEFPSDDPPAAQELLLSRAIIKVQPHLVVFCLPPQWRHVKTILEVARKNLRGVPIVLVTQVSDPEELSEVLNIGADDFITTPFTAVDVLPRLWRLHSRCEDDPVVTQLKEKLGLKQLVGESPAFLSVIKRIPPIARCNASVLVTGESGTGKEMFARAIHFLSPRSGKTFSAVTCGAIPVDLVENELFGHESGAYTSANSSSPGLLRATDGGSLFLDEIDSLPLLAQSKLLRFLQEKEFRPLGAQKPYRVDVRVIAATNANLQEAVRNGRFREDLYFRLNVITLALPPLRERKEDIPLLARHFVAKYASAFEAPARHLSAAALQKLMLYDWPGNVRELENVIESGVVFCAQAVLRPEDVNLPISVAAQGESFRTLKAKLIAQFERGYLQDLLRANHGNITRAAVAAGKHRRAFWEMMRKHCITVQPQTRR